MNTFISLLFVNGLSPRSRIKIWFEPHPIFGNTLIAGAMHKPCTRGRRALHGMQRWAQFQQFMCMFDFRQDARRETTKNPLWKVQHLFDELNNNAQRIWIPGKGVSIDDQTLGFQLQGRSGIKLRISYKKEGDGFQCDAVCDDGYTFSFYFRHCDPPTLPANFKDSDLSPTAQRVVWLALRLPNLWSRIHMDNLFNSRKLFTALYSAKCLAHGVVRTTGRGLPLPPC